MARVKERETAELIRTGRPDKFFVRLEKPDDVTPGPELFDDNGALRLFRLPEGRAWLLTYKFGGTRIQCDKAAARALAEWEREEVKVARARPEDLQRMIAKAQAELTILRAREKEIVDSALANVSSDETEPDKPAAKPRSRSGRTAKT